MYTKSLSILPLEYGSWYPSRTATRGTDLSVEETLDGFRQDFSRLVVAIEKLAAKNWEITHVFLEKPRLEVIRRGSEAEDGWTWTLSTKSHLSPKTFGWDVQSFEINTSEKVVAEKMQVTQTILVRSSVSRDVEDRSAQGPQGCVLLSKFPLPYSWPKLGWAP